MTKDEATARAAQPTLRRVSHGGHDFVASEGVDEQALAGAADFFDRKARGQGPAQQMADFAQPLLEATHDMEGMNKAMSLAMLFWNIAIMGDDELKEQTLTDMMDNAMKLESEDDRREFRALADSMIERHRRMFPELHERQRQRRAGTVAGP
jgi:hypothetical protein